MNFEHSTHFNKLKLSPAQLPKSVQSELDEFMEICSVTEQELALLERNRRILRKSSEKSIEARKAGNTLFISKGHDSKIHHDTFKHYSQSIAFAPKDTEELVLGYSNRSVLLMHLHRYDEALIDINRVLELTKDDVFKTKVLARKEKCIELINEKKLSDAAKNLTLREKQESLASKLLNFKPSATVSCAADCVDVAYNNEFGRHLVATRDIKPGEIVIAEEGQIAYPVLNEMYLVCSHCLQTAWNGIPCDECVYTMYCSEACREAASKEYHDIECPIVKYMHHIIWDTERNGCDRMADIRLLVTAIRKEGFESVMKEISKKGNKENLDVLLTDGKVQCDKFKSFYNLSQHEQEMERENRMYGFHSTQILYILLEHTDFLVSLMKKNPLAQDCSIDPNVLLKLRDALTKLKYVTSVNEYPFDLSLWKDERDDSKPGRKPRCDKTKGIVLAPCCSLLNHSCLPNITHLCVPKRKIIAFATSPIQKGEMLCDSYQEITVLEGDTKNRISRLRGFHFTCKCKACVNNISMPMVPKLSPRDNKKINDEMAKLFPKSVKNPSFRNSINRWEMSEEVLQYYSKMSQLFYKHFNYYQSFVYNYTPCLAYIEKLMSTLYEEDSAFPDDC